METTTAIILGYIGVALMVGLSGVASCVGTSVAGQASIGAMKKNAGAFGSYMILSAIPGSQGLYGFVGYFIIKGFLTESMTLLQGAAIFGAGLLTGLVCLASSYYQAKVCADGIAANAFMVTHVATATAAVVWMAIDWLFNKKPTTVGACTGAVAGLVAITPAAGSTGLLGAFCIGIITPIVCFFMVAVVKPKFKYDDALDAFGVHGIGGIVGSILTGVFATRFVTGDGGAEGALYGDWHQLGVQLVATLVSVAFSAVVTFVLYKVVDRLVGIRVDKRVEEEGLDIYEHGESAYN